MFSHASHDSSAGPLSKILSLVERKRKKIYICLHDCRAKARARPDGSFLSHQVCLAFSFGHSALDSLSSSRSKTQYFRCVCLRMLCHLTTTCSSCDSGVKLAGLHLLRVTMTLAPFGTCMPSRVSVLDISTWPRHPQRKLQQLCNLVCRARAPTCP